MGGNLLYSHFPAYPGTCMGGNGYGGGGNGSITPVSSINETGRHDVESGVKQHKPSQTYKPFVDE